MPSETSIEISPSDLAQVVAAVFDAMLSLEVCECQTAWFPGGDRLTAALHLMGEWNGAVLLECDRSLACHFASRFLSADEPDVVNNVVRDVLGEVVNMIGGNLKCLLPHGTRLSMPSVVDGSDFTLRVCGAEIKDKLAFQCAEGLFWLTVLTEPDSPPAALPLKRRT